MKKAELKAISEKHNMVIMRNPITREAWGLMLDTSTEIPELDAIVDDPYAVQVAGTREYVCGNPHSIRYKIACPKSWFDLWGWKD